jgi:DNA repair photolyase
MIDPYWGELFISPIPLEMSLNYCSHKCAYCFANLNDPKRTANMPAIMRLIQQHQDRKTFTARLLQDKYPVLISNRVDPFAHSNWRQSLPIIEALTALDIPVTLQTRGGVSDAISQALQIMQPSCWYVSITQADDDDRKRIEPGAPTIESRFALIAQLREHGHRVVVGLNPLVPEWIPDPEPMLDRLAHLGVEGIWIERLHLNYRQIRAMTQRERDGIGAEIIRRAQKRKTDPLDFDHVMATRELAKAHGMSVYSVGQYEPSDFWKPYEETYNKLFPTMQGFVNYCDAQDWENRLITFQDFWDYFKPHFPEGMYPIDSYVGAVGHNVWWTHHVPPQMTFRQLLALFYQESRLRQCPSRTLCFGYAAIWDNGEPEGWLQLIDENRMPYLVYTRDPEGWPDMYVGLNIPPEDIYDVEFGSPTAGSRGRPPEKKPKVAPRVRAGRSGKYGGTSQ